MGELKFTKATDEEHEVTLDSKLISATWTQNVAVGGSKVGFQIRTAFVGDGAKIKVTGKSAEGKKLGKVQDVIIASSFVGEFDVPEDIEFDDEVWFEYDVSKNSLSGESDRIPAIPPLEITNLKWDKDEVRRGDEVTMTADIKGLRNETEVRLVVWEYNARGIHDRVCEIPTKVSDKKVEAKWEFQFHDSTERIASDEEARRFDGTYEPPEFFFTVKFGGFEAGEDQESGKLKFKDHIEFHLRDREGKPMAQEKYEVEMADGSSASGNLDDKGYARVDDVPPGPYRVHYPDLGFATGGGPEDEELLQG
ncbi:hypothetical protein GF377_02675 [candidate division GN15 bacterium]|nr:hypothetical protein [candidate division GN15 bacterium]